MPPRKRPRSRTPPRRDITEYIGGRTRSRTGMLPTPSRTPGNAAVVYVPRQNRRPAVRQAYSRRTTYKRSGRRSVSRGRRGRSRGKRNGSNKKVKFNMNDFRRYGFVEKVENGSVVTAAQTAYTGLTSRAYSMLQIWARAIVKKLYDKAGINVQNWAAQLPQHAAGIWTVEVRYTQDSSGTAIVAFTAASVSGSTFIELGNILATQVYTYANDQWVGSFIDARLFFAQNATLSALDVMSSFNFDAVSMDYYSKVSIVVQNQTPNDSNTNADDVTNPNPVVGRAYYYNGTFLNVTNKHDLTGAAIYSNEITGLISYAPTTDPDVKKPPAKNYWKPVKRMDLATIQPGGTATFQNEYLHHFTHNQFFIMMRMALDSVTAKRNVPIGCGLLVGFEKKVDSREASQVDVKLAMQFEHLEGIKITTKKMSMTNLNVVVS